MAEPTPKTAAGTTGGGRSFNLADLFEVVADACPDRPALIAGHPAAPGEPPAAEVRLTYAELDARANRIAHHLTGAGVGPGDHVGILSYNRAEWIESMIGCFKIRAVPVNVNYRYVADELVHLLGDSGCVALIGERSLLARVERSRLPVLRHLVAIEDAPEPSGGPEPSGDPEPPGGPGPSGGPTALADGVLSYEEALAAASPERGFPARSSDDAYLLYTGGTTGLPKGVLWRCEDIFIAAMGGGNYGGPPVAEPGELAKAADGEPLRVQVHAPLMHGGGQWISWITFTTGGTVVLWTGRHFDAGRALEMAAQERTQLLMLVGDGMARPIADELATGRHEGLEVFAFGSGGAPLSPDVKERLLAAVPNAYVSDNLGGSETGAMGPSVGDARFRLGPEFAVLGEDLLPVGPGGEGIVARTGHIPLAYWGDEQKTAATFVTGPDGRRWALQGDHARVLDDGSILLLGRGSLVINTGGEKVYAEEVETVLRTHPAVADAIVIGLPDARFGRRVTAVVATTAQLSSAELGEHCRARLAGYKVPKTFEFVPAVHRTPVGKVDYAWARSLFPGDGESPAAGETAVT